MILGGFGFLGRLHGLSTDNLVEAEVVLADGQIVTVSQTEHPGMCYIYKIIPYGGLSWSFSDLWWAMRGAGPAFGVVTRYKARAYPVPVVFAGNLI
jgi:FAD/FMN-containing dehydrogenase